MKVFLVAAEASGDSLGADVIRALREIAPQTGIEGIGGASMAAEGVQSDFDISELSILGFIEGLKAYPKVVALADKATDLIISSNPDGVVLIDSWGFMLRVAQRLQKRAPHMKRIKLIGPQVWATRPARAKTLSAAVDHLLCIHSFEAPFYEPFGLPVTVIGNPALGRHYHSDAEAFRKKYGVEEGQKLITILPGSRGSEIARTAPTLIQAAETLLHGHPERRAMVVVAPGVADMINAEADANWSDRVELVTEPSDKFSAMAAGDVGLVCSGTVTTEAALQGLPMAIGYRLNWLTWFLADKILFEADYVTLFNIAADREVAPEFIQNDLTVENLVSYAERILSDEDARQSQIDAQFDALNKMGRGKKPAAEIAAGSIQSILSV